MVKARGYPFTQGGVFCFIPVPLQPHLLLFQLHLEASQDLPFPYQRNPALNEIRTQKSSSECGLSFQLSLACTLANGSISCWLSVNFSAWGFLSGVALQHEADRGLWLRRGRNSARLSFRCMIPPRASQKSLCTLIYSAFCPHEDNSCSPSSKHWDTSSAPVPYVQKEHKYLLSVEQGKGSARKFCWQMQLIVQLTGIAWHPVLICICLNELGKS